MVHRGHTGRVSVRTDRKLIGLRFGLLDREFLRQICSRGVRLSLGGYSAVDRYPRAKRVLPGVLYRGWILGCSSYRDGVPLVRILDRQAH